MEDRLTRALLGFDRRVTLLLGRAVRAAGERLGMPLQGPLFWFLVAVHFVLWRTICRTDGQPEWTWFLLGTGAGLVGGWLMAREPVLTLETGLALTPIALDARWAAFRLAYLPLVLVAVWPLLAKPGPLLALIVVDALTLAALEYLLTFRVLQPGELAADQRFMALFGGSAAVPEAGAAEPEDHPPTDA